MAHGDVKLPPLQATPEERENGRDLILEPDDTLLLDRTFSRAALSVDCGSEPPKVVTGDALLP